MPDDLARKIDDMLNKKPYAPENDLQEVLDDMARDIALIEPNAVDWGGWLVYILERMEGGAQKRGKQIEFGELAGLL